ncbi:hypothetical protein DYY67_2322 [Candidatus Nitrosotalea sp. TS]|uniref:AbrB/MazE/SpoVT family DNA-binding domain-containing protein n=1 Tax=Candidatus Nitrosotalea sp. TS TaxID=2341020 RepID=UPI00140BBBFF|nr:AbrB/MazE/SpoVT family DNA-binding domain-containing protein [Candidatus Nitrosotalea sp. TS]NHI04521.1 hypothetical protein [Candidatus Nitrosotalea sp. TS]
MSELSIGSITTKGQITIPKEIRTSLDLKEGDKVIFAIEDGQATIKKLQGKTSEFTQAETVERTSIKFQKRMRKEWQ